MATQVLRVTPEELLAEANKIQSNTELFSSAYKNIYTDVESLNAAGWWRGEAHDGFMTSINNFKEDFTALEKLLVEDFRRVLANAGADYQEKESALVGEASRLPQTSRA